MRCFGLEGESSARGRARTLLADHLAVKTGEIIIEKNSHGAIWLHFAVRPKDNRRKTMFL
jgi:hypothetical protein